jgi:hypothetical protein
MISRTRVRLAAAVVCSACLGLSSLAQGQAAPDEHGYFRKLTARKDVLASYSLREPAQLQPRANGGMAQSSTRELGVSYAPELDKHPRKQDAAKLVIPAEGNNLRNQVRLPLQHEGGGFVVTWDAWWDENFRYERSGVEDYKTFQLESGGRIWTEIRTRLRRGANFSGAVALIDVRPYNGSSKRKGSVVGGTKYGNGSLGGLRANFPIAPNTWTRFWVRLAPHTQDDWWDFSLWVADEKRDAVLLYDQEAVRPNGKGWDRLWLEYNTSTSGVKEGRGELVAYVRNVVVLRDTRDTESLLERPRGMSSAAVPSSAPTRQQNGDPDRGGRPSPRKDQGK